MFLKIYDLGQAVVEIYPSSDREADRQTDGRAIAYTRYSIYAVARKNCST